MGHPDFRVGGKIFATLGYPDARWAMVKLTPEQQAAFIRDFPEIFVPENGAWGRAGSTRVTFSKATDEIVGEAMTLAWQNVKTDHAARGGKRSTPISKPSARRTGSPQKKRKR